MAAPPAGPGSDGRPTSSGPPSAASASSTPPSSAPGSPQGPELAPFLDQAEAVAHALAALPRGTRILVDCDTDADGVCGAAVATWLLRRLGMRVHVRASRGKDEAHYQTVCSDGWEALVLVDKGSSHLGFLAQERQGRPVFVLDHHNVDAAPAGLHVLNPRLCGLDGSRHASASTTALAVALAVHGGSALALAPAALAGAIGDWQHRPTWEGWNRRILHDAGESAHITTQVRPRLVGLDLDEAATRLGLGPGWVASLGLDPTSDAEELDAAQQTRLASGLALALLARNDPPLALSRVLGDTHVDARGRPLRLLFRTVDACARLGHASTGIAYLHGDTAATAEAKGHLQAYRRRLASAMEALLGSLHVEHHLSWGDVDDPAMTGMVAGLAIESGRVAADTPLIVFAPRPDGRLQVSTRTIAEHVTRGIDLGSAVAQAAHVVASEGGGHPVAAGAVLASAARRTFLDALAAALAKQRGARPDPPPSKPS